MAIYVLLLFATIAMPSKAEFPEGIELLSLNVGAGSWGMKVSGEVINHGPYTIKGLWVDVTFLKNGKIVSWSDVPVKPGTLRPNVTGYYEREYPKVEYDEYVYRIRGEYETLPDHFTKIDIEDIPNAVEIIEESQTAFYDSTINHHFFYGEIINNTPAFISWVKVRISIYNTDEILIEESGRNINDLYPGQRATYRFNTDAIRPEDLGHYEITLEIYQPYLLPTAVERKSWGEIKTAPQ